MGIEVVELVVLVYDRLRIVGVLLWRPLADVLDRGLRLSGIRFRHSRLQCVWATVQAQGPADGALLRLSSKNGGDRHRCDEDWGRQTAKPCLYLNVAKARTVLHLVTVGRNTRAIIPPGAGVDSHIP